MEDAERLWHNLDGLSAGSSNQNLPDPEHTIAKQLLNYIQVELQEITANISSNRSPIQRLLQRRTELLELQKKILIAIAPWKRLPLELLGEIFVHSVDGKNGVINLPFHRPSFSWTLAQVCMKWRQVALNEPRIWNRLAVNLTPDSHHSAATLALNLIHRSKEILISLSLTSTLYTHDEDTVTNLMMPCASRIQNISLNLTGCLSFFQTPPGSFSSLESLFVVFTNDHLDILANGTLSVFDSTPNLRVLEVKFDNWGHHHPSTTLQLPWFQLTDVTFSGEVSPPFAMIFRVLSQCTKLINFTTSFGNNDLSSTPSSDPTHIILPNLRSLTLNTVSTLVLFNRLFAPLVTPSLEAFYIYSSSGVLRWPQWPLLSLIKRSNCSLTTLSSPFLVRVGDVSALFAALPSLIDLSLPFTYVPPDTMDAMIHGSLLPALKAVEFTVESSNTFLNLVESRRDGGIGGYRGITKASIRALDYVGASRDKFKKLNLEYLKEGRNITIRK